MRTLTSLVSSPALSRPPKPHPITVDAAHPGASISPQMFGIFFEDINFGADGGLYPELVKNRSFELGTAGRLARSPWQVNTKASRPPKANWISHGRPAEHQQPPLPPRPRIRARLLVSTTPAFAAWASPRRRYRFSAYVRSTGPKTSAPPSPTRATQKSARAAAPASTALGNDTKLSSTPTPPRSTRSSPIYGRRSWLDSIST